MPISPWPASFAGGARPVVASRRARARARVAEDHRARGARACLSAFVSASWTIRYAESSMPGARRRGVPSTRARRRARLRAPAPAAARAGRPRLRGELGLVAAREGCRAADASRPSASLAVDRMDCERGRARSGSVDDERARPRPPARPITLTRVCDHVVQLPRDPRALFATAAAPRVSARRLVDKHRRLAAAADQDPGQPTARTSKPINAPDQACWPPRRML